MTIDTKTEQEKLLLKVTGRLDTTTVPQLEEALEENLIGINHLIMDFSSLDYISSAGLRVLLTTQKKMKAQEGSMVVRGINETVEETFNITGFSEILVIE